MSKREKKNRNKGSSGHNRKRSEDFLSQNHLKPDIKVTDSGLQYQIIEETDNQRPVDFETVIIHQRAMLLDGKILIDSYKQNKPEEVKIEEMIEGLQEGIKMMPTGSRYKFWIPQELAWGKKGSSGKIPPNAVLVFDIRLIDIID